MNPITRGNESPASRPGTEASLKSIAGTLTPAEFAQTLGVSTIAIMRAIARGNLKATNIPTETADANAVAARGPQTLQSGTDANGNPTLKPVAPDSYPTLDARFVITSDQRDNWLNAGSPGLVMPATDGQWFADRVTYYRAESFTSSLGGAIALIKLEDLNITPEETASLRSDRPLQRNLSTVTPAMRKCIETAKDCTLDDFLAQNLRDTARRIIQDKALGANPINALFDSTGSYQAFAQAAMTKLKSQSVGLGKAKFSKPTPGGSPIIFFVEFSISMALLIALRQERALIDQAF